MNKAFRALRGTWAAGVLGCALAGCHTSQQVLPDHPRTAAGVTVRDVTFHSDALERDMPYRVFLPAEIAQGRKLPAVYLLHGCGGSFRNWSNYSDVSAYAASGMILVMVDGGCSYYVNSASNPADRYEGYLANDVIADVESRFPAATGREHRAIVGVSMGGYASVKLALTRSDLFAFAGAISPALDVPGRKFTLRRWSQSMRFRAIFGPDSSDSRRQADPFVLVRTTDPATTPYIYLAAGEQEPLLDPIRRFAARLKERRFDYTFQTRPGGHDFNQWNAQLPGCFESLLRHIRR